MAFVAAAIGIGGVAAAAASYLGATSAAKTQASAEQAALGFQEQQAAKNQPFINVGTGAANQLGGLFNIGPDGQPIPSNPAQFSNFTNSPDYAFALQQGTLGLQRYENANGLALSGGALKDAANFTQGLATQTYGNYFSRLMQLSQLGAGAAANNNAAAGTIGNTIGNIGASQASGIVGGANAISGGINSTIQNSLLYNAINRSSYAGWGTPASPYPNLADFGGPGVGTGGYNFQDFAAR